jgi:hypothetical protein
VPVQRFINRGPVVPEAHSGNARHQPYLKVVEPSKCSTAPTARIVSENVFNCLLDLARQKPRYGYRSPSRQPTAEAAAIAPMGHTATITHRGFERRNRTSLTKPMAETSTMMNQASRGQPGQPAGRSLSRGSGAERRETPSRLVFRGHCHYLTIFVQPEIAYRRPPPTL